jgi:hypothetical protein
MYVIRSLLCSVLCVFSTACGRADVDHVGVAAERARDPGGASVVNDLASDLRVVAKTQVYFGHQSVGLNMLDGLRQIATEEEVDDIQIVELDREHAVSAAFFAHSAVGKNGDPRSKIDEFATKIRGMRETLPAGPDVAFMKFCYVDFAPDTDVDDLFAYYRSTMSRLGKEHPHVRFLHTTVPLMARTLRVKDRIRLLLGMPVWVDDANIKRHEFNLLIQQTYDDDRIIDIAGQESTKPDGTRQRFTRNGRTYYSLNPAYTTDGGHLNQAGKRKVAAEMVRVIARNARATR